MGFSAQRKPFASAEAIRVVSMICHRASMRGHGPWTGHEQHLPHVSSRNPPEREEGRLMQSVAIQAAPWPTHRLTPAKPPTHTHEGLSAQFLQTPTHAHTQRHVAHVTCGLVRICSAAFGAHTLPPLRGPACALQDRPLSPQEPRQPLARPMTDQPRARAAEELAASSSALDSVT